MREAFGMYCLSENNKKICLTRRCPRFSRHERSQWRALVNRTVLREAGVSGIPAAWPPSNSRPRRPLRHSCLRRPGLLTFQVAKDCVHPCGRFQVVYPRLLREIIFSCSRVNLVRRRLSRPFHHGS